MFEDTQAELLCGDCLVEMDKIEDGSTDLILTDLPYGVLNKKVKWDSVIPMDELWKHWNRICKPNATIVLFGNGMFTANVMQSNPKLWKYNLIWKKGERVSGFLNANRQPLRNHEDIIVFAYPKSVYHPQMEYAGPHKVNHSRGRLLNGGKNSCYGEFKDLESRISDYKYPKSVLNIQPEHANFLHPSQKPVELMKWLIKTYSEVGGVVLDCCMGSGSTGVAAVETGRNFIGIEKEKEYFEIAKDRILKSMKGGDADGVQSS